MVAADAVMAEAVRGDASPTLEEEEEDEETLKSLVIPVTSSASSGAGQFIEVFPEELPEVAPSVLVQILSDEDAPLSTWADAALLYVQQKREREGSEILTSACEREEQCGNRDHRARVLASAGIACLTQAASGNHAGDGEPSSTSNNNNNNMEEWRAMADTRFMRAGKVDQLFPMTWVGKGMLNLSIGRIDQARFFFETTLKQCGRVLPALLGMAAVRMAEQKFQPALDLYAQAMTHFPIKSGAATRVGFGLACYKLGQVDRAKAAFTRAHQMDPENVEAMVGCAILELKSLDASSPSFRQQTEKAIKLISMANLVHHSNAMVQNHLANHYFWKWTSVPAGTISVSKDSNIATSTKPMSLDPSERIRIGHEFESHVADDDEPDSTDGNTTFQMKDTWKGPSESGLKLWKKDYDRVVALAKGAYNSTTVQEIQAESLFMLARVFHVKDDMENACKFYDRACKLAPDLSPARFGLAQTLIWEEHYDEAAAHLRLVLGTCANATDALAALGLLEVKAGKADRREAFAYLKKAIDLEPLNPDLVLLEALALQQQEIDYPQALDRYHKAVRLLESQDTPVPFEVLTNIGVLCHETKRLDEALQMYKRALRALDNGTAHISSLLDAADNHVRHKDNDMFWNFVDTNIQLEYSPKKEDGDSRLKVAGDSDVNVSTLPFKVGDHVRIGQDQDGVLSEILEIHSTSEADADADEEEGVFLRFKDVIPTPERKEETEDDNAGSSTLLASLFVKRSNKRLDNPSAISVAFNLARLHEVAGRIVPAVELHKAILRRHPSYVNSYLRLACIARDCGSLKDCSEWLKSACTVAPGNAEVLTLVGNLHLSLCDWAPAQSVFDQLLAQKVPNVEAYSMLSLGNIYFNNLKTPTKYSKHLHHAADYYKRILSKDKANAYAANGLGTVLAEKGELARAKACFDRVREVSGDTIPDTLLNLGHIYLAQKKHPEALQMYQSYMGRTQNTGAPITSKSQDDDDAQVLLYIAFAYFDWARQTELFNDARAAPADGRYKMCISYIEKAMKKSRKENVTLRYNWCMAKLQAANCVLQKLTRNIRRTAKEVQDALIGLEESLPVVQTIIQWKNEGKKIDIRTNMLNDFVSHCQANIESARSHLSEELKKEAEAKELRELQRLEAETQQKEREMETLMQKEREAKELEDREKKAKQKMDKVSALNDTWKQQAAAKAASSTKGDKKGAGDAPPGVLEEEDEGNVDNATAALFDDDSDEDDSGDDGKLLASERREKKKAEANESAKKDDDDDVLFDDGDGQPETTEKDLFGESSDEESDEELTRVEKRPNEDSPSGPDAKKRRVVEEE